MAIGRRSAEAALQSNLPSAEFLASRNSGFERRALSEIPFDAQTVALQLGPGQRLEQAVVGHGVDGSARQNLEHLGPELRTGEGPAERHVDPSHVIDQADAPRN